MRRLLVLGAVVAASFVAAAAAVGYFASTQQTYDVVTAGPPIPWLKAWSQGTDPTTTLKYATRNAIIPAVPAATGKVDGATETLAVDLGKRDNGNTAWKKDTGANRFNRLITVQVPSDAPLAAGEKVTVSVSQEATVPAISGLYLFSSLELATIQTAVNTESAAGFAGTGPATSLQLGAGDKRQVNVVMASFGQTSSQTGRITTAAVLLTVTVPDGSQLTYRVPVTVCNHVEQC